VMNTALGDMWPICSLLRRTKAKVISTVSVDSSAVGSTGPLLTNLNQPSSSVEPLQEFRRSAKIPRSLIAREAMADDFGPDL
jgi:hypothetical protein